MITKICIIEDDEFLRELIVAKLKREGFATLELADGMEAVKKINEEKPDLILLDLILPGIDGFEVLTLIKRDKNIVNIPVIILSNLGQKEDIERGFKLGAVDYLVKAYFTPSEVLDKIKSFIR